MKRCMVEPAEVHSLSSDPQLKPGKSEMHLLYNDFSEIKMVGVCRYGFPGGAERVRAFPFGITCYGIYS